MERMSYVLEPTATSTWLVTHNYSCVMMMMVMMMICRPFCRRRNSMPRGCAILSHLAHNYILNELILFTLYAHDLVILYLGIKRHKPIRLKRYACTI